VKIVTHGRAGGGKKRREGSVSLQWLRDMRVREGGRDTKGKGLDMSARNKEVRLRIVKARKRVGVDNGSDGGAKLESLLSKSA